MEHYYYTDDATICADENILRYKLKRRVETDVFEKSYSQALTLAQERKLCHWLLDMIDHAMINEDNFLVLCSCFLPQLINNRSNQHCVAFLVDQLCYNCLLNSNGNHKSILNNSLVHIRIFDNDTDAMNWLKTMQK